MALLSKDYHDAQVKRAIKGNYRPHGDPSNADCVIGVGFGYREQNGATSPSLSTIDLAHFVGAFEHLPKYLDHSLAHAYKTHAAGPVADALIAVNGGLHMDTNQLIQAFRDSIRFSSHKHPLLIAHPNHISWLDYLCGQLHLDTIVPNGLQHVRFDPDSALPWTRSLKAWQDKLKQQHNPADEQAHIELFNALRAPHSSYTTIAND